MIECSCGRSYEPEDTDSGACPSCGDAGEGFEAKQMYPEDYGLTREEANQLRRERCGRRY